MKKLLALLLTLCLLVGIMPAALAAGSYNDVPADAWYADEVAYVTEKGFMDGIADGLFGADVDVSRAMVVTILYRMEGEPAAAISHFTDVPTNEWYTKAVAWAAANGIVDGVTNTLFDPLADITREQLATILYRYAAYKGYNVGGRADLSAYADASAISDWALIPMQWAVSAGLINGVTDTALDPNGTANRAQLAAVIYRLDTEVVPSPVEPDEPDSGSTGGGSTGGGSTGGGSIGGGTITEHEHYYTGEDILDGLTVIGTRYTCICGDTYDVMNDSVVVAQNGDTYYATLANAINDAAEGDTIILLQDASVTEKITIDKNVTVDGQEHTITGVTDSAAAYFEVTGGIFTIENATLQNFGDTIDTVGEWGLIKVPAEADNDVKVVADSLTIKDFNRAAFDIRKGTLDVDTCTITCTTPDDELNVLNKGMRIGTGVVATIDNTVISGAASNCDGFGTACVEVESGAIVTLTGCDLTTEDAKGRGISVSRLYGTGKAVVELVDCDVTVADGNNAVFALESNNGGTAAAETEIDITINGGTYTGDVWVQVKSGETSDGKTKITVENGTFNGSLGSTTRAPEGIVVEGGVFTDISAVKYGADEAVITVKLGEGNYALNESNLVIGTMNVTIEGVGEATILDIDRPADGEIAAIGVYGATGGTLTVKNVKITDTKTGRGICVSGNNNADLTLNVENCVFDNLVTGIYLGAVSEANITNCTFADCTAAMGGTEQTTGTVTIDSCSFDDNAENIGWAPAKESAAKLVIKNSPTCEEFTCWHNGELKVAVENSAGEWTAKSCHCYISITKGGNTSWYETIPEAITAAEAGDTVTILKAGTYTVTAGADGWYLGNIGIVGAVDGVELTWDDGDGGGSTLIADGTTFSNITFPNTVTLSAKNGSSFENCSFERGVSTGSVWGTVTFNTCVFGNDDYASAKILHIDAGYGDKNSLVANGCTFNGSVTVKLTDTTDSDEEVGSASFTECAFSGPCDWSNALLVTYDPTILDRCTFDLSDETALKCVRTSQGYDIADLTVFLPEGIDVDAFILDLGGTIVEIESIDGSGKLQLVD